MSDEIAPDSWGLSGSKIDEITMAQMSEWCASALAKKIKADEYTLLAEAEMEASNVLMQNIRRVLDFTGKSSYEFEGGVIETRERFSVKTPKTTEQKAALFKWLEEKGVFLDYASINSNSLNSLCKQEIEIAKEEGRVCVIPGVEIPEAPFKTIHIKQKR